MYATRNFLQDKQKYEWFVIHIYCAIKQGYTDHLCYDS